MNSQTDRPKFSPLFFGLAGITLALASWGYFRLFVDFAGMPPQLAVFAVFGLDVAAVLIGKHALTVAEDGDSSLPWNLTLIGLVAVGAYAQFARTVLAHEALAIGIVSAAFPVVTVLLFEGQLRRIYRLNGRRAGRLAPPRATVDLVTWIMYRKLAMRATRLAVLDRGLDTDTALMVAERQLQIEAEASVRPPARRIMRRTYASELTGGQLVEIEPGTPPVHRPPSPDNGGGRTADEPDESADNSADEPVSVSDVRQRGDLARAVDEAREIVGDDPEKVIRIVRMRFPDALPDNIRRTLSRRMAS